MNNYKGISADEKHTIVAALKARGAGSCPRCRNSQWTVSEYSRIEVQATMDRNSAERTTIPAIMIVCENCGFISQHALQPLGVWPHTAADFMHTALPSAKVSTA
jgi:predicted nucleic-acid-binding Zn-ribbon protein